MRRTHRSLHFLIWLALVPVLTIMAWKALSDLPAEPVNEALPETISEED